jgi:trimeric autotransporter adhesin
MSKNYIIIMVAFIALVLMVLPVSAVTVGANIKPGATVFLGEEGLNITNAMGVYSTLGYWGAGSDLATTSPLTTISTNGRLNSFSITTAEFSGYIGSWYRVDNLGHPQGLAFTVADPRVTVSIKNADTLDSVDGKTIGLGTDVTFKIDTNVILNDKRADTTASTSAPVSAFSTTITPATGLVHFIDGSTNSPTAWNWSFGDGTYSSIQNPTHTYSGITGSYEVRLNTTNAVNVAGTPSSATATLDIVPAYTASASSYTAATTPVPTSGAPIATFTVTVNPDTGAVTFHDGSSNLPNTWAWDFGDGASDTSQNPTHTYSPVDGSHTVILSAWNTTINPVAAGNSQSTITATVTVTPPVYSRSLGSFVVVQPSPVEDVTTGFDYTKGYMDIIVKSPSGVSYSSLQTTTGVSKSLKGQFINSSPQYWNDGLNVGDQWETDAKSGGQRVYQSGTYLVYVECDLNGMKDNYKVTGRSLSETQTVVLGTDTLSLDIDKNSVVRGKTFSVTLTGKPSDTYTLYLKGISPTATNAPTFVLYQEGVAPISGSNNASVITTDSSGVRTIAFTTNTDTKDQKYTIRAVSIADSTKYDEIAITVAKGGVTIVAAGSQIYYLGEEIKISGTNTESDTTYFFMVGPNLNANGVGLVITDVGVTSSGGQFEDAVVQSDDTYKYDWQTAALDLDAGTYTIYAVSQPVDKSDLGTAAYGSTSITIKKPFVSATVSQPTIAKGDRVYIEGVAEGNPANVAIWILGKNYAKVASQTVDSDSTYKYEVTQADTGDLASGQYFIVVQHPMQNAMFDVYQDGNYVYKNTGDGSPISIFKLEGSGSLQGSDAAEALIQAINDPNIDDTYTKLNFLVQEPLIAIDTIATKNVGDKFTLTGKTNLAVDDELLVEIYSSSFKPTEKTQSGEFSGATGNVKVNKSESGLNTFTMLVDTSSFKVDEYIVVAQGVTQDATGTTLFNVVSSGAPTTTTAPSGTPAVVTPIVTAPTPIVTAPPTAVPTPSIPVPTETTKSPGFGAVFALIGLGAVGFIIVRRH